MSERRKRDAPQDAPPPKRRRPKKKLMQASGQTEEDRRVLRHDLRNVQKEIVANSDVLEDANQTEAFETIRDESNALFDRVCYTREAVLDGDNVNLMSHRAARQVHRLVQVPRYDPVRLTQKLLQKCSIQRGGMSSIDWITLGKEAGACYNAIPSGVTFLAGPLHADYQPKERKKRQSRQASQEDDDDEEERPEEVRQEQNKSKKSQSHVEKNMKVQLKTLRKNCKAAFARRIEEMDQTHTFGSDQERQDAIRALEKKTSAYDIDAIQYLFNPQSFTQTVENMFFFSFLVSKGEARITGKDNKPMVRAVDSTVNKKNTRQSVIAFTMKDWKELCQAYNVTEGDLPHRSS